MVTYINTDVAIAGLQASIQRLEESLSNGDISLEVYYSRVYPLEYELECLNDIY